MPSRGWVWRIYISLIWHTSWKKTKTKNEIICFMLLHEVLVQNTSRQIPATGSPGWRLQGLVKKQTWSWTSLMSLWEKLRPNTLSPRIPVEFCTGQRSPSEVTQLQRVTCGFSQCWIWNLLVKAKGQCSSSLDDQGIAGCCLGMGPEI